MLKSIELLQNGQVTPKSYQASITMHRLYDLKRSHHSKLTPCHTAGITALDLDRVDERYLLSGAKNGDLVIHDIQNSSGKPSHTAKVVCKIKSTAGYAHKQCVVTAQWYPFDTGLFITSGMDHKLKIWDTRRLKPVDTISMGYKITGHNMSTICSQHSLIAVAMKYPHIVLVDPKSGARCHELRAHRIGVTSVRWSPISEYLLASGGADNKIFFWDIRSAGGFLQSLDQYNGEAIGSKKDLKTAHNGIVNSLRFTDDGLHLVSHGVDGHLKLWDVALCKNTYVNFGALYDSIAGLPIAMDMCCDSNLPVLFVPCNNNVYVYDLFSGSRIKTLLGHFSLISVCVYRSCKQELYSAGNDRNILIWNPDTEKESEDGESPNSSPDVDIRNSSSEQLSDSDSWSDSE